MKPLFVILSVLFFAGCHVIDDDLSVCKEEMSINYQVQLHTTLSVQLQTELAAEAEIPVRTALEKWLEPIFTDKAKDIDLRFYSAAEDEIREQIRKVINDNRTSETVKLKKDNYMHLAVANIEDNRQMQIAQGEHSATMQLCMPEKTEVNSLNTGVFTARLPMKVDDKTKQFDVHLYMVTSAVALVIDTTGGGSVEHISGTMSGSACRFQVRDSTFAYDKVCTMLMEQVPIVEQEQTANRRVASETTTPYICLATVGLATRDNDTWEVTFTATLSDNRRTTTTLTVYEPLKAGSLRIIKTKMKKNGGLDPEEGQQVGASVELDWKKGGDQDIEV